MHVEVFDSKSLRTAVAYHVSPSSNWVDIPSTLQWPCYVTEKVKYDTHIEYW